MKRSTWVAARTIIITYWIVYIAMFALFFRENFFFYLWTGVKLFILYLLPALIMAARLGHYHWGIKTFVSMCILLATDGILLYFLGMVGITGYSVILVVANYVAAIILWKIGGVKKSAE